MKKTFKFFAVLAAASLAFSCAKVVEENIDTEQPEKGVFKYTFRVSDENGDLTKTTLNGNTVAWESGDKIGVFATGTTNKYGTISELNPVQFPVYLSAALSAGDKVYCYYPYSSANNSKTANAISITIPSNQNGDFDAMPQVSLPYEVTSDMASGNNNVDDIYFCNLGSVAQFMVYSSTGAYTTESVESITLDANTGLAGAVTFDLTAVDYSDPSTLATTGFAAKSAKVTASPAIGTTIDNAGVANLVIAPGTYYGTILVKTDKAKYTYTIAESNKITFNRSKIKKLALNLESANCERVEIHPVGEVFIPTTSVANGDVILITNGNSGSVSVMGFQKSNNRDAVSYTIDGGAIISTAEMYPLLVKTGTVNASYFSLYDPDTDGYLYAASSGSNHLKTQTNNDKNSEWEIVLNSSSEATTFKATGSDYSRNIMRFNSNLFSCYDAASYDAVYVFKKSTATFVSAANQDIAYNVTDVEIDYNVYNGSGSTTVAFKTNPGDCASNLTINEGTKKVSFDITENTGATRTVEVNITNNGVTKTVSINQAAAPSKLVMSDISAVPGEDQIVFSWPAVDNAIGYQVSTNDGSSWDDQTTTSYTWTGLSSFTFYTIKVKAIADGVYHLDSDAGSLTAKTTLALPTSITWTKNSKTVSWTDTNTGVGDYGTAYKYQYTIDNGASFIDVDAPGNTVTLAITETKTFKIKAVYISNTSLNSALSSGTTCIVGAPAVYTASFNGSGEYTNNPSYGNNGYTVSGKTWTLSYADIVSTGSPLDGTANIQGRIAKKTTNSPSAVTANLISSSTKIEKVTFWMSKTSNAVTFTVQYSTDGGSSWSDLTYSKDNTVDATYGYSGTLSTTTSDFRLKFTWSVAESTNSNRDQKLDNVIVYGE